MSNRLAACMWAHSVLLALMLPGVSHAEGGRFTRTEPVAGEAVVSDATTGLVWQGCPAGMWATLEHCLGTQAGMSWQDALQTCEELTWAGQSDWRLPDVKELTSIVDDRRSQPSLDLQAFPDTPTTDYYVYATSTGLMVEPLYAWRVNFNTGTVSDGTKTHPTHGVRCVRGGLPN